MGFCARSLRRVRSRSRGSRSFEMKDDIRKYLPDLATVLREADPARIKALRDETIEEFERAKTKRKPVEEPAPVEVPEQGAPGERQAKETLAPGSAKGSRRTITVMIVVTVAAPFVIWAAFAKLTPAGKTSERAAASVTASAAVGATAVSSSSMEEMPAASAGPAASASG